MVIENFPPSMLDKDVIRCGETGETYINKKCYESLLEEYLNDDNVAFTISDMCDFAEYFITTENDNTEEALVEFLKTRKNG